jgi:hypothetical protein
MGKVASSPIPFGQDESQGLEELGGGAALSLNMLQDATQAARKRPAIIPWTAFPAPAIKSPVDGIATFGNYIVYVTRDRRIYAWLGPGNVIALSDGTAPTMLDSDQRPVLCETKTRMIIAGGGLLQKWEGAGLSARLGGNPPRTTHVVALATNLVVNVRGITGQIQWSDSGEATGHESWPALNFRELAADSDPCTALYVSIGELLGFGTRTLEMLAPSTTAIPGGFLVSDFQQVRELPNGIGAAYSVVKFEDNFAFLDNLKRMCALNGRSSAMGPDASGVISSPAMTKVFKEDLGTVSDAWAFRLTMGAWDALAWVFPTAGRTFCYNLNAKTWSEWASWGPAGRLPLGITAHCYHQTLGLHLVGDTLGNINVLDLKAVDDNGSPIVADMVTGFIDRGALNNKVVHQLNLTFRRGSGTATVAPKAYLSWRDNTGPFQPALEIDLGVSSDTEPTVSFFNLGVYRTRQWQLTMSDAAPFTFVKAQESYEVLEV